MAVRSGLYAQMLREPASTLTHSLTHTHSFIHSFIAAHHHPTADPSCTVLHLPGAHWVQYHHTEETRRVLCH